MTDGGKWPTEHTEHTEGFLQEETERTENGGRRVGGGRRAYGPSQTHGLESPCHVAWAFQPMSGRPRIAGRVELRTRSGSRRRTEG